MIYSEDMFATYTTHSVGTRDSDWEKTWSGYAYTPNEMPLAHSGSQIGIVAVRNDNGETASSLTAAGAEAYVYLEGEPLLIRRLEVPIGLAPGALASCGL